MPSKTHIRRAPDEHFEDVLTLVNREDIDYETRLDMLQNWLAGISDGTAIQQTREDVQGAIFALQAKSELKQDMPEEAPQTTTYGGVRRSNLRTYGARRLVKRLRGLIR